MIFLSEKNTFFVAVVAVYDIIAEKAKSGGIYNEIFICHTAISAG